MELQVVILSGIVSLVTSILLFYINHLGEHNFHIFKLESDHKYNERKKIKEILAKNKIQLLNSCESLNHRFWNLAKNYKNGWHSFESSEYLNKNYYIFSFGYRLLSVFAWVRKIEKDMVYLDTTIATKEDLEFIKFLRLFPQIMCDTRLYAKVEYNYNDATDHFFKNHFEKMSDLFIKDGDIITYSEFEKNYSNYLDVYPIFKYLNGISPDENRFRWDRLQVLHIAILSFLNSYGYDFQYTDDEKLKEILYTPRLNRFMTNYEIMLKDFKLNNHKEVNRILELIKN